MNGYACFYVICLLISIMTLELLIVSGFRSAGHRLLPLIVGLIVLYDFYLLVECKTGPNQAIDILEELFLVQVMNLVVYYIVDFMELHLKNWVNVCIMVGVFLMDVMILTRFIPDPYCHYGVVIYTIASIFAILILMHIGMRGRILSKRVKNNNMIMFFAMFVPSLVLIPSMLGWIPSKICMPAVLMILCIVLSVLFYTDRLRDVSSCLKEEMFATLDVAAILLDLNFCYIDASSKARLLFPEIIETMEADPDDYPNRELLYEFRDAGGQTELSHHGAFYSIILQEAYYNGKMQGYILRWIDITAQRKEAEAAKEITRQKSEFLANMSHDLRSPLHAILGGSEIILSRKEISNQGKVMANRIHEAGENLLDMVNSILDFSKLESGNLSLHPKEYNFRKLVEEVAQIGFINLKKTKVKFSVEIENEFPEVMYGDSQRVRQVMQNLLSNAIKFTDQGEIRCRISTKETVDHRIQVIYQVSDTGSGMRPEQLETIFGDYVTYAGEQKKEGTGLGLSIVRKLAEKMEGQVQVESEEGKGSVFTVQFIQDYTATFWKKKGQLHEPVSFEALEQIGSRKLWDGAEAPTYIYPEARVLIVDDLEFNRVIMRELLAPWKMIVDEAENGLIATEMVRAKSYDLVIMDQMMPVMTGTEAADIIGSFSQVPMVLLTANITEEMRQDSYAHGFKAYLQKPVENKELKAVLEEWLPAHLRKNYVVSDTNNAAGSSRSEKGYLKALTSCLNEMKQIREELPKYLREDLSLYRTKVHGIKGVSRQFGKTTMGMSAEIMEMAAIAGHETFIEDYFDVFSSDLDITISEIEAELQTLMERQEKQKVQEQEAVGLSLEEELALLQKSIEDYDIEEIEHHLELLEGYEKADPLTTVLEKVSALTEDLEYDEALDVLNEYLG